jgi:hypothetical protein
VEDEAIRDLVTRLARPHRSGGAVIERAAILAEGEHFDEIVNWILARGGTAEAVASKTRGGLHGHRFDASHRADRPTALRFVLPPGALVS